jgi:hypothetical protein
MKKQNTNISKNYKKHFNVDDIVLLVQHLVKDKYYNVAFMLMVGSTLGYKVGVLLNSTWSDYINENGTAKSIIRLDDKAERPTTNFLKDFIEYIYNIVEKPTLDSSPFLYADAKEMDTKNLNRELRKIQTKYESIVGMPYLLESETMRRVFGLNVWAKWNYQNAALSVLRKHFNHNSDKRTREFLMIPEKIQSNNVNEIFNAYDPKWLFSNIALD